MRVGLRPLRRQPAAFGALAARAIQLVRLAAVRLALLQVRLRLLRSCKHAPVSQGVRAIICMFSKELPCEGPHLP